MPTWISSSGPYFQCLYHSFHWYQHVSYVLDPAQWWDCHNQWRWTAVQQINLDSRAWRCSSCAGTPWGPNPVVHLAGETMVTVGDFSWPQSGYNPLHWRESPLQEEWICMLKLFATEHTTYSAWTRLLSHQQILGQLHRSITLYSSTTYVDPIVIHRGHSGHSNLYVLCSAT